MKSLHRYFTKNMDNHKHSATKILISLSGLHCSNLKRVQAYQMPSCIYCFIYSQGGATYFIQWGHNDVCSSIRHIFRRWGYICNTDLRLGKGLQRDKPDKLRLSFILKQHLVQYSKPQQMLTLSPLKRIIYNCNIGLWTVPNLKFGEVFLQRRSLRKVFFGHLRYFFKLCI